MNSLYVKHKFFHCTLFLIALITFVTPIMYSSSIIHADEVNNTSNDSNTNIVSQDTYNKAISGLAIGLQKVYNINHKNNSNFSEEDAAKGLLEYSSTNSSLTNQNPYYISAFSAKNFGNCLFKKMGIYYAKSFVTNVFNKQVIRALKSHAWKVASAVIMNNIKHKLTKKIARILIKAIAKYVSPYFGWTSLAIWTGECLWRTR
ncbi:hypothetical protein WR164_13260 [Philodulcilactobacillus myokoensis]|uniref:Uncharacterized protein n=1 Tax=Philodulcilactobacillus myokoensis TaxID=2929573 RepID=A0A9W6ETF3_9LACO|nr:hypothetical protein [Philodulcilactobacillus myokoensis]GLB47347.1 hypothetical protein WR164_13260 [Philodulcilactobacillus myokoensis]